MTQEVEARLQFALDAEDDARLRELAHKAMQLKSGGSNGDGK
jgi:hypothetical protein